MDISKVKLGVAKVVLGVAAFVLPAKLLSQVTHTVRTSWYGKEQHGRRMANGKAFNELALTAAHRTIPLGTKLLLQTPGHEVVVEVTDRGPWIKGRDLDISMAAAEKLDIVAKGVALVSYSIVKE